MRNVVLVGFMGTGKSVVGKLLALRLGCPFLDLDREIERKAGRTVQQIFEAAGEPEFRRTESEAVREATAVEGRVIATGGGVMCDPENVRALKSSGLLVCLTATPEVILDRTSASLASRPLLAGANPKERIQQLLKLRAPYYAQADITIDTSGRMLQQVVEEILCKIETFKPSR